MNAGEETLAVTVAATDAVGDFDACQEVGQNVQSKRKRNNQNQHKNRLKQLSHSLSWALRHKALDLGLPITKDGYVPVQEILGCPHARFRGFTVNDVREVVTTCEKQRYCLEELPATNFYDLRENGRKTTATGTGTSIATVSSNGEMILCIRANQGHSMSIVDANLLLERLSPENLSNLPTMVHGTSLEAWQLIRTQGLCRMTRNHIHFATGLPQDNGVISGLRKNCEVFIHVDTKKCAAAGVKVFRSDNGVLLTSGVDDLGILPAEYFSMVTDSSGSSMLSTSTLASRDE